jgi:hypothetical protein
MKSISKPLLLVEIYASQEIMSTENFRKKSGRNTPIYWGWLQPSKNYDFDPNP